MSKSHDIAYDERDIEETANRPGPQIITAYNMAHMPIDIVHRATLRAMLPVGVVRPYGPAKVRTLVKKGHAGSGRNITSDNYLRALYEFNQYGWIERGKLYVKICNRAALMVFVQSFYPQAIPMLTHTERAIKLLVNPRTAPHGLNNSEQDQRRRELQALYDITRESR